MKNFRSGKYFLIERLGGVENLFKGEKRLEIVRRLRKE